MVLMKNPDIPSGNVPLRAVRDAADHGIEWLLHSGIQNQKSGDRNFGAVSSWYDASNRTYAYAYPEITGYAVTLFMDLHSLQQKKDYIRKGEEAALWIEREVLAPSRTEIKFRLAYDPLTPIPNHSYTFDNAMIMTGLVHLFRATGRSKWLKLARGLADRMLHTMQDREGFFHAYRDIDSGEILESGEKWSQQPGVHHAKLAVPLMLLFEETGENIYQESALKVGRWAAARQEAGGRFVTNLSDGSTTLHPHCYALEGLFFLQDRSEAADYQSVFSRGLDWLAGAQRPTGGLPVAFMNGVFLQAERADALAQTIRLLSLALSRNIVGDEFIAPLFRMVRRLLVFQQKGGPDAEKGGFRFYADEQGHIQPHMNAWVTMFAVQALNYFLDFSQGIQPVNMRFL